jgi:hypothetical protein
MQHRLHHGEFVQIGVEQTRDDHVGSLCVYQSSQWVKSLTGTRGVRKVFTTSEVSA